MSDLKRPLEQVAQSEQDVEEKTQREWLLQCPETYLGGLDVETWSVPDFSTTPVTMQSVTLSPALLHIVQELIVNGLDNGFRDDTQTYLKISFHTETGVLSISNDGPAPPVTTFDGSTRYKISGCFGSFQCGANFDASDGSAGRPAKKRQTAGKNGIGAAAANTYSEYMTVSVHNAAAKKHFRQKWESNMSIEHKPQIKASTRKVNETSVECKPDYKRFPSAGESALCPDLAKVISHLSYCASLCAPSYVKVSFNGQALSKMKTPQQFCKALGGVTPLAHDTVCIDGSEAVLEICVAARETPLSEEVQGVTMGFVNTTPCSEGSHADYVVGKVAKILETKAQSKQRKGDDSAAVKPAFVKRNAIIVLKVRVDRPRFRSQKKTALDTNVKDWGWTWTPSEDFVKALERSPLVQKVLDSARDKADMEASKAVKTSTRRVFKDAKYEPAQVLYKPDSTILITEGDSAKNFGVAGLSVTGRKKFGIYPVRGKFLNVRGLTPKKVSENEEARKLLQILGLSPNPKDNVGDALEKLPYGRLMVLSDQDVDGAHIAALLMNLVHVCAPQLLVRNPQFLSRFATALIRVKLPGEKQDRGFFSEVEYDTFRAEREAAGLPLGTAKYYKGLGTSDSALAKQYFRELNRNTIVVRYTGSECDEAMDLSFNKGRAADRKTFLEQEASSDRFVDYALDSVSINRFVRDELLPAYAQAAIQRGIPSLDGLNNARRKILWGARELGLTKQTISVANAAGKISAKTNYHHRGTAMEDAIIGMAGCFVGCSAGNLNLLVADGQFGSRHNHEAASAAYPKTMLNSPLHSLLYPPADNPVLEYVHDEGTSVEPTLYAPVIAMPLCFGTDGIAVGWSTKCPCYNPLDLIAAAEAHLDGADIPHLVPFYRGFEGTVQEQADGSFLVRGKAHYEGGDLHVTEVPPFKETDAYKEEWMKHEELAPNGVVPGERATDEVVHLVIKKAKVMDDPVKGLGLEKRITFTNVHLIGPNGRVKRYTSPEEVVVDHASLRLAAYEKRLAHQVRETERELRVAQTKASFIRDCLEDKFVMKHHDDDDAASRALSVLGYDATMHKDLLHLPSNCLTRKRAEEFLRAAERKASELEVLKSTTPVQAWKEDLVKLKKELGGM